MTILECSPVTGMQPAFTEAYAGRQWYQGSGSGSLPENTAAYRRLVTEFIVRNEIGTVLDLGCGEWRTGALTDWAGARVTAVDVVPGVIEKNQRTYRDGPEFVCADILADPLPRAELVLIKDVLQHWPDDAIRALGARLAADFDGCEVLLTYDLGAHAGDIEPGGYRPLDLREEPFCWLAEHLCSYQSVSHEGTVSRTKTVDWL